MTMTMTMAMTMTMTLTTSVLIIAAIIAIASTTTQFVPVIEAFQPVVTPTAHGLVQQQQQQHSNRIRTPSFIPTTQKSSSRTSSRSSRMILYRIRCENKYYQLEELEDAENCTTELFLKENGVVELGDTDGPLYTIAKGSWEMINNQFAMSITKTYQTGNENKDVGVFTFEVERQFMGEMTVVGGTEVAVNGKIYAEDIITDKMDKEVGFFNMIDGTDLRLERREDARPTQNTDQGVGIEPSPIESNDVVDHAGIPQEWGITASELRVASEQVTGGSSKRSGVRRSGQCCNKSKFAAPLLHAMVSTWSSCVELPIQRLFICLSAQKGLCMYGGDACDAYAHALAPEMMWHLTIDDAYFEWYKEKTGKTLKRRFVLPLLHSLQGHPESGKMWMKLIDRILIIDLGFSTTTKDCCIYKKKIEEHIILLLRQVDDFCCSCTDEQDAKNIYNLIGTKIQF